MGWTEVSLKDVKPEKREEIELGEYTFELLPGAKFNDYGAVAASAAIVSEGAMRGRRAFISYPDPTGTSKEGKSMAWSAQALKKLEQAIGIDAEDGEGPVEYLNRAAGSRFGGAIIVAKKPYEDGSPKHELGLFTVKPAV